MAELFQNTQQNISLHLQNIYEEGELEPEATHKESLSVRSEGNREVSRNLEYYNLDAIISVGYRVKSRVATSSASGPPSACVSTSSRASCWMTSA